MGVVLGLLGALPVGLSVVGCGHKAAAAVFCNASDLGPTTGQVATITLSPTLATTGESLNYTEIGQQLSASAIDCKGAAVGVSKFFYATSNMAVADINPANGQVCAGVWNRNTGGNIPDFTVCLPYATPPPSSSAYVTATANGATSNAIVIYVHPVVTGIVLGGPTPGAANGSCPTNTSDPGTDCCPNATVGTPIVAPSYVPTGCISQHTVGQLVARIYANGKTDPADNITCSVGHVSYSPLSSGIVTIDQNGAATANLPGSTLITANVSNSSTATQAGYFATCPPTNITLSVPGSTGNTITVGQNNLLPITAKVTDKNGVVLDGLSLEFQSTNPQTIPASTGSVTPIYPGTAVITAVCLPGSCNPAPFSQIGLFGNGQPITSNGITINTPGTATEVIYMGSTQSLYVTPRDFTLGQISAPIKLQYQPNSMVITQDGSVIYLGSTQGLETINTINNSLGAVNENVPGTVLSVSPDNSTVVVTDPVRQTVSLYSATGHGSFTSYGGVANSAKWTPDSQTVYITLQNSNLVLTHSNFTNWEQTTLTGADQTYTDAAVMVPSVGAFFAGKVTEGRSYCPAGTLSGNGTPSTVNNIFTPLANESITPTDKIAATNDGLHIIGATATLTPATLSDINLSSTVNATPNPEQAACPPAGQPLSPNYFPTTVTTQPLTGVLATAITHILPAANSAITFVTYQGTGGLLPEYIPTPTGPGTLKLLTLGNGATAASAPVSGVYSTDGFTFYAGTSGDNQVHLFSLNGTTATETGVLSPALPAINGNGTAPVDLIAQKPRKTLN